MRQEEADTATEATSTEPTPAPEAESAIGEAPQETSASPADQGAGYDQEADDRSRRGAGFVPLAAAGLIGGLAGAALAVAISEWRSADVGSRLTALEERLGTAASQSTLQALDRRVAGLETAQTGFNQRLQSLQSLAEASAARAQQALDRPAPPPAAPSPPASATPAELAELTTRVEGLQAQVNDQLQAIGSRTEALDRKLSEQDQRVNTVAQQVSEQSQRLTGLAGELERRPEAAEPAIRLVLADRLENAVRSGAPYADLLSKLRGLEAEPAAVSALEPFAREGAPTVQALLREFRPLGERMIRDERAASDGWSDRLLRMADRIVSVRPVHDPGSNTLPALVARIEDALERGALSDAAAAWDALPEPARRASEDWGRRLKQRAAAGEAAHRLSTGALSALEAVTR